MNSSWQGIYDNLKQCVKKQRHHYSQRSVNQVCGLTSSHERLWELDHKEGRVLKNWCFLTVVLEKTLESPLDSNDIKAVNLKGNQPWIAIGRADAEAPILWPPDVNNQLIGKDLNAGKDWRPKEKRPTEDEMDMNLSKLREMVRDRVWRVRSVELQRVRHNLMTEQQQQQ